MGWTQPLCDSCWKKRNPDREPFKMMPGDSEQCCLCGQSTDSGIYDRIDPSTVRFPSDS